MPNLDHRLTEAEIDKERELLEGRFPGEDVEERLDEWVRSQEFMRRCCGDYYEY